MRIRVSAAGARDGRVSEDIETRVRFALGRFAATLDEVRLRLDAEGDLARCEITARARDARRWSVCEDDRTEALAAERAIDRLGRALARASALERAGRAPSTNHRKNR